MHVSEYEDLSKDLYDGACRIIRECFIRECCLALANKEAPWCYVC